MATQRHRPFGLQMSLKWSVCIRFKQHITQRALWSIPGLTSSFHLWLNKSFLFFFLRKAEVEKRRETTIRCRTFGIIIIAKKEKLFGDVVRLKNKCNDLFFLPLIVSWILLRQSEASLEAEGKNPCPNNSGILIGEMLWNVSFSRLFHTQRGLQDRDGRGQPVQNERINCKAYYSRPASFDFQLLSMAHRLW